MSNQPQICGELLTSALSKYYIHNSNGNRLVEMADSVLFIQIVDKRAARKSGAPYPNYLLSPPAFSVLS